MKSEYKIPSEAKKFIEKNAENMSVKEMSTALQLPYYVVANYTNQHRRKMYIPEKKTIVRPPAIYSNRKVGVDYEITETK